MRAHRSLHRLRTVFSSNSSRQTSPSSSTSTSPRRDPSPSASISSTKSASSSSAMSSTSTTSSLRALLLSRHSQPSMIDLQIEQEREYADEMVGLLEPRPWREEGGAQGMPGVTWGIMEVLEGR